MHGEGISAVTEFKFAEQITAFTNSWNVQREYFWISWKVRGEWNTNGIIACGMCQVNEGKALLHFLNLFVKKIKTMQRII